MSVPLLIGNFKSEADYRRKLADQQKLLKLQTKLNTSASKSSLQMAQIMNGVIPAAVPEEDVSVTLQDINRQRQDAIIVASEVMTRRNAFRFVDTYLKTLDDLVMFNQYWGQFSDSISGIKNIDPLFMNTLWRKFERQVLAGTSDLASLTTLQDEVDSLARDVLAMAEGDPNYRTIETQVKEASRNFDIKALQRLRRKAMGIVEREAQRVRAEETLQRLLPAVRRRERLLSEIRRGRRTPVTPVQQPVVSTPAEQQQPPRARQSRTTRPTRSGR